MSSSLDLDVIVFNADYKHIFLPAIVFYRKSLTELHPKNKKNTFLLTDHYKSPWHRHWGYQDPKPYTLNVTAFEPSGDLVNSSHGCLCICFVGRWGYRHVRERLREGHDWLTSRIAYKIPYMPRSYCYWEQPLTFVRETCLTVI